MKKLIEGFLKAQLPLNSPDDIHPDDKGSAEKSEIFPWEDVKKCMDDKIGAVPNHLPCPICGKPSEDEYGVELAKRDSTIEQLQDSIRVMQAKLGRS